MTFSTIQTSNSHISIAYLPYWWVSVIFSNWIVSFFFKKFTAVSNVNLVPKLYCELHSKPKKKKVPWKKIVTAYDIIVPMHAHTHAGPVTSIAYTLPKQASIVPLSWCLADRDIQAFMWPFKNGMIAAADQEYRNMLCIMYYYYYYWPWLRRIQLFKYFSIIFDLLILTSLLTIKKKRKHLRII